MTDTHNEETADRAEVRRDGVSTVGEEVTEEPMVSRTDDETPSTEEKPPIDASSNASSSGRDGDLSSFLICPITNRVLQDPVVLPDGKSYERAAVEQRNETVMYPNRALKTVISDISASTSSIVPKQSLLKQAVRFFTAQENRPLPNAFYCPITLSLMHKPVIDPQGYTYEKIAIYKWIEVNGDSPVTRAPLAVDQLIPNHALEGLLDAEANRDDIEDIHPAILKWKKESAIMLEDFSMLTLATGSGTNADATNASAPSTNVVLPFATTPEELEALLAEARNAILRKRLCRCVAILSLVLVMVVGFFVPVLAAIALVCVVFGIWCVMSSSTTSAHF